MTPTQRLPQSYRVAQHHRNLSGMPFADFGFLSDVLGHLTRMRVLLPPVGKPPFATLYLLHGLTGDQTAWTAYTRLPDVIRAWPLMIVMPDGGRSFYTDHVAGPAWGKFIGEEVVRVTERYFPADPRREKRGIGGLSMGGYGALRTALAYPQTFGSAHSHSGALAFGQFSHSPDRQILGPHEFLHIFGEHPQETHHDLVHLAQHANPLPRLRIDCGTEDLLLDVNRQMHQKLEDNDIEHEYAEHPGAHDWSYWDRHIMPAIEWHAKGMGISRC